MQQTDEAKKKNNKRKQRRKGQGDDGAHGGANHENDDANPAKKSKKTIQKKNTAPADGADGADGGDGGDGGDLGAGSGGRKGPCTNCGLSGHTGRSCPHPKHPKAKTPNPDEHLPERVVVAVFDAEFSRGREGDVLNELAHVITEHGPNGWTDRPGEFRVVLGNRVARMTSDLCPGLAEDAAKSSVSTEAAITSWVEHLQSHEVTYIKAHNGVSADMGVLCNAAREAGMDLCALLVAAGIKGIIDPARIIIAHELTQWQHPPTKTGGKHRLYLSNDRLFELTTQQTMAAYTHEKLTPHRALDDAKAERIWLKGLPGFTDVLFGRDPQRPCSISLEAFKKYRDQKEARDTFQAGLL